MKAAVAAILASLTCATAVDAAAQGYPAKPVRIIVPYAAGGPPERLADLIRRETALYARVIREAGVTAE